MTMGYPDELTPAETAIREELRKARAKFPKPVKLLHAFQEEAGEVTRAFLQLYEAQEKVIDEEGRNLTSDELRMLRGDIRKELTQAAAMAIRLLEEGDPEFPEFKEI